MSSPIQHITTKALFYKDNKVLFVKDTQGKWEMPSGKIEPGETPEQTIKRELKEELGFNNVKIGNIINVWVFNTHFHEKNHQYFILIYECFTNETDIRLSHEHTEYKWIPIDEVDDFNMEDGHKESVRKYRELKNI